jgi:hypothetical protein
MKIATIAVLLFVGISFTAAHAQMLLLHVGSGSFGSGGGGGCPTPSLDFTTSCNSMYVAVIH